MREEVFAQRVTEIRGKLFKTAILYMGSEAMALDALDEAVYKGLRGCALLRQEEYFDTWMMRILINECKNELRRQKRLYPLEELSEQAAESYDCLPLKEAIARLPGELKDIIVLRYFSGYTLSETAKLLKIPQGTAATRQRRALKLLRLNLEEEGMP